MLLHNSRRWSCLQKSWLNKWIIVIVWSISARHVSIKFCVYLSLYSVSLAARPRFVYTFHFVSPCSHLMTLILERKIFCYFDCGYWWKTIPCINYYWLGFLIQLHGIHVYIKYQKLIFTILGWEWGFRAFDQNQSITLLNPRFK